MRVQLKPDPTTARGSEHKRSVWPAQPVPIRPGELVLYFLMKNVMSNVRGLNGNAAIELDF
jgi:hypothetical protein